MAIGLALLLAGALACVRHAQRRLEPARIAVTDTASGSVLLDVVEARTNGPIRGTDVTFTWMEGPQDYCAVAKTERGREQWWVSSTCKVLRDPRRGTCFPAQDIPSWDDPQAAPVRIAGCTGMTPPEGPSGWGCGTGWERTTGTISGLLSECSQRRESPACMALRPKRPLHAECEVLTAPPEQLEDGNWWALEHRVEGLAHRWDRREREEPTDGGHRVCWEAEPCEPAELRFRWSRCRRVDDVDDAGIKTWHAECASRFEGAVESDGCAAPDAPELPSPDVHPRGTTREYDADGGWTRVHTIEWWEP